MKYKYRAIYSIENLVNNKVYIGSSIDVFQRWGDHKKLLKYNKHENKYLQNAYNKDGSENFIFSLIESVCIL